VTAAALLELEDAPDIIDESEKLIQSFTADLSEVSRLGQVNVLFSEGIEVP
jgi:hypothetical protein